MTKPKVNLSLAERRKNRDALKVYYSTLVLEPPCEQLAAWAGHKGSDTLRAYIEPYIDFMIEKNRNDDGGRS